MENDDAIPKKVVKFIADSRNLLRQEFNFYTFGLELNQENRVDVMGKCYNRVLEKQLADGQNKIDVMSSEIKAVRKTLGTLKKTEEESYKKIHELQMRCDMQKEEMQQKTEAFEKRINTLIRDFVKVFKKLVAEF